MAFEIYLTDTIFSVCKELFHIENNVTIQATIGLTIDNGEKEIISINHSRKTSNHGDLVKFFLIDDDDSKPLNTPSNELELIKEKNDDTVNNSNQEHLTHSQSVSLTDEVTVHNQQSYTVQEVQECHCDQDTASIQEEKLENDENNVNFVNDDTSEKVKENVIENGAEDEPRHVAPAVSKNDVCISKLIKVSELKL